MSRFQNINKKDARILTIISFIHTLLWLCFFYFGSSSGKLRELIDSPNALLIIVFIFMILGSLILPFIAIYYWHLENFSLRSKFITSLIFSLSPWIFIALLTTAQYLLGLQ